MRDEPPTGKETPEGETLRARKTRLLLTAIVCLAAGFIIGGVVTILTSGYRVPSERELERLCTPARGVGLRPWKFIILHHSAADVGGAASINRAHRDERGWENGLGYDFVIGNGSRSADGAIEVSERWRRQLDGAHCKADDMNRKAVGICFVGNFEEGGGPSDAQIHCGIALVRHLAARFAIPPENVLGHGEVKGAQTLCPGRFFPIGLFRAAARVKRSAGPAADGAAGGGKEGVLGISGLEYFRCKLPLQKTILYNTCDWTGG